MTLDIRQFLGLLLVAVGLVAATAGLMTIVDVTLLEGTLGAAQTPDEPDIPAAPPSAPSPPSGPADEPTEPAEIPAEPTPQPAEPVIVPEAEAPSVVTAGDKPAKPAPEPTPDVDPEPPPPPPPAQPPPTNEPPVIPPVVTASCGSDWKPEDWPWVERAGNQGQGNGWGPPISDCAPQVRRATASRPN